MKYTFSFKEINYGSIVIVSDHKPETGEVIDAIMNGSAYYKDTEYDDIQLAEPERISDKTKNERDR